MFSLLVSMQTLVLFLTEDVCTVTLHHSLLLEKKNILYHTLTFCNLIFSTFGLLINGIYSLSSNSAAGFKNRVSGSYLHKDLPG